MKKQSAPAIYFQIEVPLGRIGTWAKEEFNTTVPADTLLVLGGYRPDISIFNPEVHGYQGSIIGHFHFRLWKMIGASAHIIIKGGSLHLLPWRAVPVWILYCGFGEL